MNKNVIIGIAVVVGLAIVALFFVPRFMSTQSVVSVPSTASVATGVALDLVAGGETRAGGLIVKDTVVGTGAEVTAGMQVTVNYVGALANGTVFDASAAHGQPFVFVVGAGRVIPGWDQGLLGMKVGGKRLLAIPPDLAYGSQPIQGADANGNTVDIIPANSTLVFEVELVKVETPAPQSN